MSRLSRRAFKDSSSSPAFIRKASRPPRCSTERKAWALIVIRTRFFSASLSSVTLQRFGRKRRLVRRLAWLTLLPVSTALPVSSQRRAIVLDPSLDMHGTRCGWQRVATSSATGGRTYTGTAVWGQGAATKLGQAPIDESRKYPDSPAGF